MSKNSFFFGQPIYGQLIKSLDRDKIVGISRKHGGERYVKSFDGFTHLVTMPYAVIMRFDSLREIETSMAVEVRKLHHVGIETVPKRNTLSDANAKRSEKFFEEVYRDLYEANKGKTSIWRSYSTIRTRTWKKCSQNPWNRHLKTLKTSRGGLIHAQDNVKYYL